MPDEFDKKGRIINTFRSLWRRLSASPHLSPNRRLDKPPEEVLKPSFPG